MSDTPFELPADTEEGVAAVRARYRALAAELHRSAVRIREDLGVVDGRWGGSAAPACQREVLATARLTAEAAETMHQADAALLPYQDAVAQAHHEIAAVHREYVAEQASYEREMEDIDGGGSRAKRARAENADYYWHAAAATLGTRHGAALSTVHTAAARARARLEELGSRIDGRQVHGATAFGAQLATLGSLPMMRSDFVAQHLPRIIDLLTRAAEGDSSAATALRRYQAASLDPTVASALAQRLGPAGMLRLPADMSAAMQHLRADSEGYGAAVTRNAATLGFLATLIATATRDDATGSVVLTSGFVAAANAVHQVDTSRFTGYWALGQILCATPRGTRFGGQFARAVGSDVFAWARKHESVSAPFSGVAATPGQRDGGGSMTAVDPRMGALAVLQTNPQAARDVLLGMTESGGTNLDYFLTKQRETWGDQGRALGDVVRVASSGTDPQSIDIATTTLRSIARHSNDAVTLGDDGEFSFREGSDALSGARGALAGVVIAHLDDVVQIASTALDDLPESTEHLGLSSNELALLLADLSRDDAAYGALVLATVGKIGAELRAVPTDGQPVLERERLQRTATGTGHVLGQVLHARTGGLLGDAAAQDRHEKALGSHLQTGLDAVETYAKDPRVKLVAAVGSEAIKLLLQPDNHGNALARTASHQDELRVLLRKSVEREVARRGIDIFDPPVTGRHTWCDPVSGKVKPVEDMTAEEYREFAEYSKDVVDGISGELDSAVEQGVRDERAKVACTKEADLSCKPA